MPKPYMPRMAKVEAILPNELIKASPVNVAEPILVEALPVAIGPIPMESILGHPLGSNI